MNLDKIITEIWDLLNVTKGNLKINFIQGGRSLSLATKPTAFPLLSLLGLPPQTPLIILDFPSLSAYFYIVGVVVLPIGPILP